MTGFMRIGAAVIGALALAAAAPAAAKEIKEGGLNSRTHKFTKFNPDGTPLRAKVGVMMCELCGRGKCVRVKVQGPCTVPKAVAALKRRQGRLRHRGRAVTPGDYKPLARKDPAAPVGRAKAAPKRGGKTRAINPPALDDRSYDDLRDETLKRVPAHTPEWTDHNESDPGIALLQLYQFNPTELKIKRSVPWSKNRSAPLLPEVDDEVLVDKKSNGNLRRKRGKRE